MKGSLPHGHLRATITREGLSSEGFVMVLGQIGVGKMNPKFPVRDQAQWAGNFCAAQQS
jgi:hypothetical protein